MVRKAPATTKKKGSQKNETHLPGVTDATDIIQQSGNPQGIALDNAIANAAREKSAEDFMNVPVGGLNNDIASPTIME